MLQASTAKVNHFSYSSKCDISKKLIALEVHYTNGGGGSTSTNSCLGSISALRWSLELEVLPVNTKRKIHCAGIILHTNCFVGSPTAEHMYVCVYLSLLMWDEYYCIMLVLSLCSSCLEIFNI